MNNSLRNCFVILMLSLHRDYTCSGLHAYFYYLHFFIESSFVSLFVSKCGQICIQITMMNKQLLF